MTARGWYAGPGSLFEVVTATMVGADQPRFWVASPAEADALISGAGMVFTVGDLHLLPAEHGERWAIVRAPVLVADVTLAAEAGELLAQVGKMTPGPWTVRRFDVESGLVVYQIHEDSGHGVDVICGCDEADRMPDRRLLARLDAHGLAALRNRAAELLTRALAEIDRLRAELRARGGR